MVHTTAKACIYKRVSGVQQVDGASLSVQEERLRAYAIAQGWDVVKVYEDAGLSGARTDRPAFQAMMESAKSGDFDVILVYKLDRLTRSVKDFHDLADRLESYNVSLVSVTQSIDTSSPTGRLLRNILVDFANFERELITERVMDGKRKRARQGQFLGGQAPFGYTKIGQGKSAKLELVPEEASIVRQIFEMYLTYDYSQRDIARKFGLYLGRVQRILRNPVYTGKIAYGMTNQVDPNTKQRRPMDEWIIADGTHEPIISWETYEEAQKVRVKKNHRPGPRKTREHLFTKLVFCGRCGSLCYYYSHPNRNGSGNYQYYRCRSYNAPQEVCGKSSIRQEDLEEVFVRKLQDIVNNDSVWNEVEERAAKLRDSSSPLHDELGQLRKRHSNIARRIGNLVESLADGELASIIRPRLTKLEEERKEVDESIKSVESRIEDLTGSPANHSRAVMTEMCRNWRDFTEEDKREGIRILVERIELNGKRVTISWTDKNLSPTQGFIDGTYTKSFYRKR